jgi:TfoX/Sxy family transcriptional regulator of competence genes
MSRSLELLTDACTGLPVTVKKMFGGHGFFAPNGGMFAGIVTDDEVIFKLVSGPLRDELIAAGGHPWTYQGRDKPMTMQEWIVVPERFYDDSEALRAWAAKAHGAVPGKALAKKKPKRVAIADVKKLKKAKATKKPGKAAKARQR